MLKTLATLSAFWISLGLLLIVIFLLMSGLIVTHYVVRLGLFAAVGFIAAEGWGRAVSKTIKSEA